MRLFSPVTKKVTIAYGFVRKSIRFRGTKINENISMMHIQLKWKKIIFILFKPNV